MAATVSTVLDLTNKANGLKEQIASGWYKASQAMDLFPVRLTELRQQSDMYTSLLNRYGMDNDSFIEQPLKEAIKLLEAEEIKLERLQDSCCWGIGRKLFFPDSVITALDGVLAAYKSLPEHISARERVIQQLEMSSHYRAQLLPFSHDVKYVPLQKSVLEVRTALESETTGRIVVLSGGPGQGKSCMAKYLACLYQAGIEPTTRPAQSVQGSPAASSILHLSPKRFVDGVFFLRCGTKVNTKGLLAQLWQDIGFQALPLSTSNDKGSAGDQKDVQDEERVLKQLSTRLTNQKVLIILDDLWDPTILDKLVVQRKWVKYLITTQVPSFRDDAIEIHITKPDPQEANLIVANYVRYPKGTGVSTDVKAEIDAIIEESDSNPLVLANVATNLRFDLHGGEVSQLAEWKSTRKYLADLQDGDRKRPVSLYGRTYSKKTMGASMEMLLNSFSNEEQTLVLLASIFGAESIPEIVFKIAFKSVHSTLAKFTRYSKHLEAIKFIEIVEKKKFPWSSVPQRSWSIHTMRQNFIKKIKKEEIVLMFAKLCEQSKHDHVVGILIVIYGQDSWRHQAARKLEIPLEKDESKSASTLPLSLAKPFVWLLQGDPQEKWEKTSHQIATQILHKLLHSCESSKPDVSHEISLLLTMQETIWYGCEALGRHLDILNLSVVPSFHKILLDQTSIESLLEFLSPNYNSQKQNLATLTLGRISKHKVENAIKIGSFPNALERLVGLLGDGVDNEVHHIAAWTLGHLSEVVVENRVKIGSFPHAVERLAQLLGEGVNSEVQRIAAWVLGNLSKDVKNAVKIESFPHVVERLVKLLGEGVSPEVQSIAAWTLRKLSEVVVENRVKIGSFPHAVERLVQLLGEGVNSEVQVNAACVLGNLSTDVVENAVKIGSFPHVVERLVELLGEGVSPEVQTAVAWTLGQISENVEGNAVNIGSFPFAIERLARLLAKDRGLHLQLCAAESLSYISWVGANQGFLKRALLEDPGLTHDLVLCASSKKQEYGWLQYYGAQVYHLANGVDGEEIKYQSSMAYAGQGEVKVSRGDFMGALGDFENGVAIDKDCVMLLRQRAFVKTKLGDFEGALADANASIELGNDRAFGLQERGILKRLMRDLPGALADLDEGLKLQTDDYETLKHRGLVKFLLQDEDGARADAEWALRVRPPGIDAYRYGRGSVLGTSSVEYLGYKLK